MVCSVIRSTFFAHKQYIVPKLLLGPGKGYNGARFISHASAVDLHYEVVEPPTKTASIGPLVICHGLL